MDSFNQKPAAKAANAPVALRPTSHQGRKGFEVVMGSTLATAAVPVPGALSYKSAAHLACGHPAEVWMADESEVKQKFATRIQRVANFLLKLLSKDFA